MLTQPLTRSLVSPLTRAVTEGGGGGDPFYKFANLNGDWAGGDLAVRRNVWQYTENVASDRYAVVSSAKDTATAVYNGITLTRLTASNFYGILYSAVQGLGLTPFTSGKRYLVSCFVRSTAEQFVWMRQFVNSGDSGHGAKLIQPHVRRVWCLMQASSAYQLNIVKTPSTTLGTEAQNPTWISQGATEGSAFDVYIGGFQIEEVSASYKDGIALIGDSTMEGASGSNDSMLVTAREVSVWLGALLNVNVFNRANGGDRTDTMDARWGTDMTPLAVNCKYAVIQGGINDLAQDRALADIQASITSMVNKATTDGLIPVLLNCTPTASIGGTPAREANRLALNSWMAATFTNVIDIASVVADPSNPAALNPAWVGDGTHYTQPGKRQVGIAVASWAGWAFTRPTPYQKVTAATYP